MTTPAAVDLLLIEDDSAAVELTKRAFERAHVTNPIATAADGAEALDFIYGTGSHAERADAPPLKAIFLDLKLPKVSGLEVLARLKSNERTRAIPVVVLTASAEAPDVQAAYRLGANSYLVKPMDFEKFAEAIRLAGLYWLVVNKPPL